jgi:mRNA interferase HigB
MRIIALSTLRSFWEKHPQASAPLQSWYQEVSRAEWKTPTEIKAQYGNASFVGNCRVVFNIKGNDYRIVVAVAYRAGVMFIKFVGTHQEYDQINVETVEHKA